MKKIVLIITLTLGNNIYSQNIDTMNREQFKEHLQRRLKFYLKNYRYEMFFRPYMSIHLGEKDKAREFNIKAEELYTEEMRLRVIELLSMKWNREELDSFKRYKVDKFLVILDADRIKKTDTIRSYNDIYDSVYRVEYSKISDDMIIEEFSRMSVAWVALHLKDKRFVKILKESFKKTNDEILFNILAGLKIEPYYSELKNEYQRIKLNTVINNDEGFYLMNNPILLKSSWGKEGVCIYSRLLLVKDFLYPLISEMDFSFRGLIIFDLLESILNKEFKEIVDNIVNRDKITDKEAQNIVKWIEKNKNKLELNKERIDIYYYNAILDMYN